MNSQGKRFLLAAMAVLATAACNRDNPIARPDVTPELTVGFDVSTRGAAPGSRVAVAVWADVAAPERLAGLQGFVRFDPARMRYVGQSSDGQTLAITNDARADRGELRVASLNAQGLPRRTATFVFDVVTPGYADRLSYALEVAATMDVREISRASVSATPIEAADLAVAADARRLTIEDWELLLWPDLVTTANAAVPGQYLLNLRYGDARLDNNLNVLDAADISNTAVGNNQLINGTDAPARDRVVAANVRPANDPGLGEPSDAVPPGLDGSGTRTINVLDAVAVAQEVVGNPQSVVGEIIPGRGPLPTNRIIVTGNITTATTWTSGNIYEIQGIVRVNGGGVLTIEAGTRIEGLSTQTSALFIERDGQINAVGTALEPIVFTCTAATKAKGCWSGLFIAGNAHINTDNAQPNSPVIPGRAETGGCLSTQGEGGAPFFGGCNDDDNSGTLKYVRIEYAGFILAANNELNGLSLGGVGRGTTIDFVQIHAGLDDGIEFFGGAVNAKHLLLTANSDDAFDLSFGWSGNAQFVIVQQDSLDSDKGIEADNNEPAGFENTPVTTGQVWNMTLVGEASPTSSSGTLNNNVNDAIQLRRGNAMQLNNAIVLSYVSGLDLDDAATCTAPEPNIQTTLFAGLVNTGNGDGSDPVCSGATTEVDFINAAGKQNQVVASGAGILIAPFSALTPDFRPASSLPGGVSIAGATPPATPAGFYDQTATYRGAVPQSTPGGGNIPWYAGWTRGWQSATTP
jgi:hypothetical protein